MSRWILVFMLFVACWPGQAQSLRVSGEVIDAQSREPLAGATLRIRGTAGGVYADDQGQFSLEAAPGDDLVVSFTGFEERSFRVGEIPDPSWLVVALQATPADLFSRPVVVTARLPVEPGIPAPLMTLAATDLQRDEGVSITPALNRVPGLLMQSGSLNTNRITIRGIGNRTPFGTAKIRAYLDEIPLTTGAGETTIEDIDLSLLDRVQIWKGPTASTYGAGLGGMIHLQTGLGRRRRENTLGVQALIGSFGLARGVVSFGYGQAPPDPQRRLKYWHLDLNYNRTHSDGYRENNAYDREAATLLARLDGQAGHQTTLLANFTRLKAFIPSSLNRTDFLEDPRRAAFTWAQVRGFEDYDKTLLGLSHRRYLLKRQDRVLLENTSSLFTTFRDAYESRPFNILTEQSRALGGRTRFDFFPRGKGAAEPQLTLGGEGFLEYYDWQTFRTDLGRKDTLRSDQQERRAYFHLFAEARIHLLDRLELVAGVNLNRTGYQLEDQFLRDGQDLSGDRSFDPILSPRLGLRGTFGGGINAFATLSHGFSPPTLEETLTPEGVINPGIRPEQGWNLELGLRRNSPGQRLNFELTLYRMLIRDLLVARRTALDQYVGINAGRTTHNGLEVYAHYQLTSQATRPLNVFITYAFADYHFRDFIDGEADYSGNVLTGTAPHIFNAGLDFNPDGKGPYGNINFRFVDAMPLRDDNSIYSEAYRLINLQAGYRYSFGPAQRIRLDLYAGISNLFDERYASMFQINAAAFGSARPRYYYPGLPRNYYAGLRLFLAL